MASSKHKEYVDKLLKLGKKLGYDVKPSYSKDPQGDAVWFQKVNDKIHTKGLLPVVAFEVLCSETPKSIKGSIATLQHISPALGVLAIIDSEYAKKAKHYPSYTEVTYPEYIKKKAKEYAEGVSLTSRIEIWDQKKIDKLYDLIVDKG